MRVVVVTGFDLGWDNVVGVFPVDQLCQVEERFSINNGDYYVQVRDIEDIENYD